MIVIDYRDKRPIYEQVIGRMQDLILQGILETDEKLPSVRSLAMELSINPNTIQRAYAELEHRGFLYTVKGRGNFVADCTALRNQSKQKLLQELQKHLQDCREAGIDKAGVLKMVESVYTEEAERSETN